MEWFTTLSSIVALVGGTGGIITLYTARAKKNGMEIDNFKKLFDETQEERKKLKQEHQEYRNEMDAKIEKLEKKVEEVNTTNARTLRAVNTAYRCPLPKVIEDCPVIDTLKKECGGDFSNCKIK